ncbi:MAG: Do family serine endopeptidase [Alphaproteobacteria bacterium]
MDLMKSGLQTARSALQFAAAALAVLWLAAAPAGARPPPDGFADLAEQLMPAVVNIATSQKIRGAGEAPNFPRGSPLEKFNDLFGDNGGSAINSLGSGFIISADGVIVTNNHVIEDADQIDVILQDGTRMKATLVGRDTATDLAVLRVKAPKPLPFVKFGDANKARVGDWVVAIGNPFGLGGSVSAGIISARNRNIEQGRYDDFIQTDAAINRGKSGGPLFNVAGEVIGVNTAIYSPGTSGGSVGVGFSLPSDLASSVVSQILQFGETHRGWLGVRLGTITPEIATRNGLPRPLGAMISGITDGGPAARAGLRPGDIVITYDGKAINEDRLLTRYVADTPIGKNVKIDLLRDGKKQTVSVVIARLDEHPAAARASSTAPDSPDTPTPGSRNVSGRVMGMTLAEMNGEMRRRFSIDPDVKGLVVTSVDSGSDATGKVQPGDVVVEMAFEPVETIGEAQALAMRAERRPGAAVLLYINRNGDMTFRSVKPRKG